jgi:branched-chain amino acid transport system permease protein
MDATIALFLAQDGITNGAIYTVLALALVMVFAVTRIIFIPQGEFLSWGALTMAMLEMGQVPGTIWLLLLVGLATLTTDAVSQAHKTLAHKGGVSVSGMALALVAPSLWMGAVMRGSLLWNLAYPLALAAVLWVLPLAALPLAVKAVLALMIVVPMGPMIYRLAFQPVAEASILVLLIVSVALHTAMVGIGLLIFGPEGSRTTPFSEAQLSWGSMLVSGHTLAVLGVSLGLIVALYLFFDRTLYGKALRATAVNRNGARLMGISPALAGRLTFLLAAFIGVLAGLLFAPLSTVYYDSGFIVGLKGFVAAIVGGLGSYPLAALGAVMVGLLESFSSFWASAFKDVLVFTLIIPVLVWRSFASHAVEEDE